MTKCYKMIGIIKRLSVNIPRDTLLRIYKSFIRPHLDYGDIIYDKPNNEPFKSKIENIQYKACIALTGVIEGTSTFIIFCHKIVNGDPQGTLLTI